MHARASDLRRRIASVLALVLATPATAATLEQCAPVRLVDEAGRPVVGIEDMALDAERRRVVLSAYDRRAVAGAIERNEVPPEGGLYALASDALAAGEVAVARYEVRALPPGGLRPHGIALAEDRLAVVNRTVAEGRIVPVVDRFEVDGATLRHRARLTDARLCRPNDVAWNVEGRLLVTNDHGACGGPALWWERLTNSPSSFVMAMANGDRQMTAAGFRFANGIALNDGSPVVAATRGRRLHRLEAHRRVHVPLPFAPDNVVAGGTGAVWTAGPVQLWRYAAFRAGWLSSAGPSRVARWRPGDQPDVFDVPPAALHGPTVALPVGDRLLLGSAYDDRLLLCERPQPQMGAAVRRGP